MSLPQTPNPAKLVIGLFMKDKDLIELMATELTDKFGPVDTVSAWLAFDFTSYYASEMGTPLFRRMFSFKDLIRQDDLAAIKLITNDIENKYTVDSRRKVNIDPGYMLQERFVLATGKNFSHRIYIGQGIYADLTLIYQKGAFQTLPWTYPDYTDEAMHKYLQQVRHRYVLDLKQG